MIYETYKKHIEEATVTIQQLDRAINKNSLARLFVILVGGGLLFYSFQTTSILLVCGLTLLIVLVFAFFNKATKSIGEGTGQSTSLLTCECQ